MSVVINTNSAATGAANNLAASTAQLQRSLNRLSSGSKIVNPADDAGGLAVSMKLSAAARRQGAVANNLGNATSYLQTQDGVLGAAGKILNRVSELKVLYSDVTKSASDRANYQSEFAALQTELNALGNEKFNGVALFGSTSQSVATTEDGNTTLALQATNLLSTSGGPATTLFSDDFNRADGSLGASWTDTSSTGSPYYADTLSNQLVLDNLNGSVDYSQVTSSQTFSGAFEITFDLSTSIVGSIFDISLDGSHGSGNSLFSTLTADTAVHSYKVVFDGAGNADMYDGATHLGTAPISGNSGPLTLTAWSSSGQTNIKIDNFAVKTIASGGTTNFGTVAGASDLGAVSLSSITGAVQDVATHRANNGASQSRLGFAGELLTVNKANLEAANSRITDVDVAAESTALARYNVLVQAGTAMLSQANQSAQMTLKLLG